MAKEVLGLIKLQIPAGGANPSPPVGPALGQRGLNIMDFCKAFNEKTKDLEKGAPIPVVITAYKDRSFDFVTKLPPVSYYLKKAAKIKKGKNRKNLIDKFDSDKTYDPIEAIKLLKENSFVKFEESLEVSINLGIDSNKTDQNIRGVINLPKGTGKKVIVAVMAKGDKAKEASDSGADIVGDDDIAQSVTEGKIEFDLLIATPDMMPTIGKIGKILGPKGLMPNPKLGTVTQDIKSAVQNAKAGQVQYRNDKAGIIHAGIGKLNFAEEDLLENLKAFYSSISKSKPDGVKGSFIKKVSIASTMGFGLKINLASLR